MPIIQPELDYIDKKTKTIHLKDGRTEPLSEESAYSLFESKGARDIRQGTKKATEDFAKAQGEGSFSFLRNLGDNVASKFLTQYVADPLIAGGRAITPGEGQEQMPFLSRLYENLEAKNRGEREAREPIHARNPKASLAGTVGSVGLDLATPVPKFLKNPVAGGVAYGAMAGDKPLYEDPIGGLKNAAIGGGIGIGVGRLQKVANQRAALRDHPNQIQKVGELNRQAQGAFEKAVESKLSGLDKNLPKGGVGKSSLNIPGFINAEINVSPIAGSSQANGLIKFFETVEKGLPNFIKEADLKKVYRVIETKLAQAAPEEIPFLNRFREHIVETLPLRVGQAVAKEKLLPKLIKDYQKALSKTMDTFLNDAPIIKALSENPQNKKILSGLKQRVFKEMETRLNQLEPEALAKAIEDGSLNQMMAKAVTGSPEFYALTQDIQKVNQKLSQMGANALNTQTGRDYAKASDYIQRIKNDALGAANQAIGNRSDYSMILNEAAEKAASKISNAVGVKNPFISKNIPPTNMRPTPMPMPEAPQVGKLAQSFENPNFYKDKVKGLASFKGGFGGVLAAKALGLGNAAAGGAGIAALTSMLRGATRPDALGSFNRNFIQKGGVPGIIYAVSQKPSYNNGILLDPQDRRDVVSQIENDPDIPLGDKAVLQAKINRGISLEQMLEKYGI